MSYKTFERLEYLRKANSNPCWINNAHGIRNEFYLSSSIFLSTSSGQLNASGVISPIP